MRCTIKGQERGTQSAWAQRNSQNLDLINVGTSDMGLYRFKDDSGADNNVVADELTPVALFVGLRTENFTTQDLFNVFTYS